MVLTVAARLGIATLGAFTGYVALAQGIHLPYDWYELRGISGVTFVVFFLAVIYAYWRPSADIVVGSEARRTRRRLGEWTLVVVGVVWAGIVLVNPGAFAALVHIAIRGVENYQPTRWLAREFEPANLSAGVSDPYFGGAIAAGGFLLAAALFQLVMIRSWQNRRTRYGFWSVSLVCLVAVVGLVGWFRFRLLPEYSPIMAEGVRQQSLSLFPVAGVLAIAVSTVIAWRTTASPRPEVSPFVAQSLPGKRFLHDHPAVIAMGLAGAFAGIARDLVDSQWYYWGWWSWIGASSGGWLSGYLLEEPFKLMGVAAVIVLGRRLWAWWRGEAPRTEVSWSIEPGRFAAAWTSALSILLLLLPVATWLGSAVLLRVLVPT